LIAPDVALKLGGGDFEHFHKSSIACLA
jgi:hypothetical protein